MYTGFYYNKNMYVTAGLIAVEQIFLPICEIIVTKVFWW